MILLYRKCAMNDVVDKAALLKTARRLLAVLNDHMADTDEDGLDVSPSSAEFVRIAIHELNTAANPSLKTLIEGQMVVTLAAENEFREQQKILKQLQDARVTCVHEFSAPMTGYEHEGGYCVHCGINELHAQTLKHK